MLSASDNTDAKVTDEDTRHDMPASGEAKGEN